MFDDFYVDLFLNNSRYLWPVYALFLCLLLITINYIISLIRNIAQKLEYKRDLELQEIVVANSDWFQQVIQLNNQTNFYADVVDNGRSFYYMDVNSKAAFDRTTPTDAFNEFLILHQSKVERALEQVQRNRIIYEVYTKKYNALHSNVLPKRCDELGIEYDKFCQIEKKVINKIKLSMVHDYAVTCYVSYISPRGRNRYFKHLVFYEPRICAALKDLEKKKEYQATEEWRRKNERSKATPSLRYDVMKRDGFKCCLCGRSAERGAELEVDHIIPVSRGGSTTYNNLQTLCRECNRGKGTKI